jgi:hypothetical protein
MIVIKILNGSTSTNVLTYLQHILEIMGRHFLNSDRFVVILLIPSTPKGGISRNLMRINAGPQKFDGYLPSVQFILQAFILAIKKA